MTAAIAAIAGFLLGSIPFALLIGLARGVDIRTVGSKNPGATNLGRALGMRWFLLCFVLDAGKGFAPTFIYGTISGLTSIKGTEAMESFIWLGVMACPILGHMYSPWIGFKGGKGVASGLGSLLGVFPMLTVPAVGAFVVFVTILAIWRYVGLASVLAAASLPLWVWYFFELLRRGVPENSTDRPPEAWPFLLVTLVLAGLVIYKHRANLARLASGTEPKVGGSASSVSGGSRSENEPM